MSVTWQLQDAKNRFSQLVEDAIHVGPQLVTRRGDPVVVVVSIERWRQVTEEVPRLKDYLRAIRLDDLDLSRESGEREEVTLS
jgi:antitoxin Phd